MVGRRPAAALSWRVSYAGLFVQLPTEQPPSFD
jgi:hypothetical protein